MTQWNDKSGSSNHFTPTSGTPTLISDNGRSVVNFTSGTIMRSANQITFTTSSAFFIVSKLTSLSAATISMVVGFTNIYDGDYTFVRYNPSAILNGTAATTGSERDLGNNNYYVNGTFNPSTFGSSTYLNTYSLIGTVAPILGGTSFLTLSSAFMSRYFIGNIAEFLYYPSGITSSQRQQVEGYLAQKWGLRSSLPGGHPGITSIIYPTPRRTATVNMTMSLRPYYTEFSPRSIAGCSMWVDGADPAGTGVQPANGATVSTWVDKSGNTNNGTSGTATFNRDSVGGFINFTGSQTYSITNPNVVVNQYFTIFVVEQLQNYAGGEAAFMGGNGSFNANLHMRYTTGGGGMKFGFFGNDLDASVTAFLTNSTQPVRIWSFSFLPSSRVIYLNGTSIGSDTNNIQISGWGGAAIGAMVSYGGQYYNGKMREVMIYSGSLITAQRQQVESYLAQKWGLTASLPAGHLNTTQPVGIPRFVTQVKQKILPIITQRFPLVQTSALIVKLDGETYTGGSTWTDSVASANWSMGGTSYDSSTKTVVFSSSYAFADSVTNFNSNTHTVVMYYYRTGNSSNPYGYGSQVWVPGSMLYQISRSGSNTDRQISIYEPSMWEYSGTFGLSFNANTTLSGTTGWVMRAFVKNGSTGTFYLNGVADGTQTVASGVSIANREFAIGRDWRDSQGYLQAKVALFAMWNIALSASEIATIHANCKGQFGL